MEEDLATSVKKEFEIVTHASGKEAQRLPPNPPPAFLFFKWHLLPLLGGFVVVVLVVAVTSEVTSLSDNERRGAVPRNAPFCEASSKKATVRPTYSRWTNVRQT